jgi:hypothetical protein
MSVCRLEYRRAAKQYLKAQAQMHPYGEHPRSSVMAMFYGVEREASCYATVLSAGDGDQRR